MPIPTVIREVFLDSAFPRHRKLVEEALDWPGVTAAVLVVWTHQDGSEMRDVFLIGDGRDFRTVGHLEETFSQPAIPRRTPVHAWVRPIETAA